MLPTLEGIRNAAVLLAPHGAATPLVSPPLLRRRLGCDVRVKVETTSPIASFKWRGALTAVLRDGSARGVVTSSTGNHGQGVAWAAAVSQRAAHIFLPRGANPVKREKIALLGAAIHDVGDDLDEAKDLANEFARAEGFLFIDDGDSRDVIEGAGTVGLEIGAALSGIDVVIVPMGSGSLAAGVAIAIKASSPAARVVAVQAEGAQAMVVSFHQRKAVECPVNTIADGLICRVPAQLALDSIVEFVDDAITVTDEEIVRAMKTMALEGHLLVEPAAGASLAAALKVGGELAGKRVVLIATGANVTAETMGRAFG